ncbi:serine/threonine protein kinase [Xenorhabdus sp. Sc-CR9]|uniref:serine/threonine protein kinase n=1 Tax=Xenorhabdus sp. Sc-CR9 TaxID=2584468 RepID=UPI001F1F7B27|nr:serine/threonine protein kinase [Xenorhabdus sp. Sc-CR9]
MTNFINTNNNSKLNNLPIHVECHTEWGKLQHVIVGRADNACIPPPEPAFMARIPENSDMRGRYGPRSQESIDAANEQLDGLSSILISRGIRVDRPSPLDFNSPVQTPDFTQGTMFGCQPPRDILITIGREILEATMSFRSRFFEYLCYRPLIAAYMKEDTTMRHESAPRPRLSDKSYRHGYLSEEISIDTRKEWVMKKEFVTTEEEPIFEAADIVRCGRDLFVQHGFTTNMQGIDWLRRHFPDYRIHAVNFPGDPFPSHIDCTLLPLRPGLVLNNPDRPLLPAFRELFIRNDWQIIEAAPPAHHQSPPLCYSSTWLSMNMLSLDEKTVCVEESEIYQIEQLDKLGFEVIPVPFRNAYPFGGGLHCATTDIWREGNLDDYFAKEKSPY